ncbi:hypothetical protein AAFC00_002128 [Neodothiora populina]|uniref:Uncharacterized protein n=1 Tax=Neodothiora populina TaxID=2781224 RepID=A0ABR3PGL4_9PEZI
MRFSPVVLALPTVALAAEQVPLMDQVKGWFNKATQAISSSVPSAPSMPSVPNVNPVNAAAAKVADLSVERVTLENYKEVLVPGATTTTSASGIDNVMLLITGGNKTCFGVCGHAEAEWNKSIPLIAASKEPPRLVVLNCETDPVLCNAWAAGPPTVMYMQLPKPLEDQSTPATSVYSIALNRTSVTAGEIAAIHTDAKYAEKAPYEGYFHPFDGQLAQYGLAIPFGYAVYYFNMVPSWAMMVGISFLSRTFMSKKAAGARPARPAAAAAAAQ